MALITTNESEKKTQGRRKIEIKPLAESSRQQVTFSKRRVGLFKKAGELAILCDSQVAVIAFSPGKKPFLFGHPNPEAVINRFVDDQKPSGSDNRANSYGDAAESALPENLNEINKQYEEAGRELEKEKRRGKDLTEEKKAGNGEFWWDKAAPESMGVEELEYYMAALQDLKMNVEKKLDDVVNMKPTPDSSSSGPRRKSLGHVGVLNLFAHKARDAGLGVGLPTDSLLCSGFGPFVSGHGQGQGN